MTFTNEGVWDRVIRVLAGLALEYAAWITWPDSILSQTRVTPLVFLILGTIALVTGIVGWCAAYAVFGISTKKKVAA
jgi:hypothetical protein